MDIPAQTVTVTGKKTILMIEDDSFLRGIILKHLEKEGYTVIIGTDGEDGMKKIAEKIPDMIILDLTLPGMTGFEMMTKLKQEEATKNIPFIIFSNLVDAESSQTAKQLGALEYIVKANSNPHEIVNKIEEYFKFK